MHATSHERVRPTRRTIEIAGERHTVRATRPSRQRQITAALAEQGVAR